MATHIAAHMEAQRRQKVLDKKHMAMTRIALQQVRRNRKLNILVSSQCVCLLLTYSET